MVMGQFVTTYRKDYLWPYVKTLGLKPQPDHLYQPQYRGDVPCPCHCLEPPRPTSEQILGPEAYGHDEWSRLGPMGPLLEPKVFPARISATPESNVSRYNQPNVFLERLKEKYPFIYECLKAAPPDDLLARINRNRLTSTYQVDFCNKQEYPSAPYDELLRAAGVAGLPPCPEPVHLPGDVCRPLQRSIITKKSGGGQDILSRGSSDRRMSNSTRMATCAAGFIYSQGMTEYQDTVSRLGQLIIRDKLLDPARYSKNKM